VPRDLEVGTIRIALLGDIHGNLAALEAVLADIGRAGVEAVLCTGDLVNYGPEPVAVIRRIQTVAAACVVGNHDRLLAHWRGEALPARPGRDMAVEEACLRWTAARLGEAERAWLGALPKRVIWGELLLVHGSPLSPDEYVLPNASAQVWAALAQATCDRGCTVLAMGHTHIPLWKSAHGIQFFNPGSVGWPKDGDPCAAYGLLSFGERLGEPATFAVRRVTYDTMAVVAAMRAAGLPEGVAAAIATGGQAPGA
jgi:putative phosphoesterase